MAKHEILLPLTNCINKCITTGTFPTELKLADITPLFKKGDPKNKANYRPISLLPLISKIYERVIHFQLSKFADNFLSPKLCGFRKNYSTQYALFELMKKWQNCLDKSGCVGTILMDLSKAYDCIPHDLLIAKLAAYGLDKTSLLLILDYLNDRKQRVKVKSTFSFFLEIFQGIPQGSILGPILFNIFLNDLLLSYQITEICNFADDNTLYECNSSIEKVKFNLEKGLHFILCWFKNNSMVANPDKFQLMFLGREALNKTIEMKIENTTIKSIDQVRLLGVEIDNKLSFKNHITNICNSANNRLRALYRIRGVIDTEQCKFLANAFILSNFQYCNTIWMFCNNKENNKICNIHKRTLRCIYNEHSLSYEELLTLENTYSLHVKNLQSLMVIIYQTINKLNPVFMQDIFKTKITSYDLRSNILLTLPECKSKKYGVNCTVFKGSLLWNTLPNEIKNSDSTEIFKNKIKNWNGLTCTCPICK